MPGRVGPLLRADGGPGNNGCTRYTYTISNTNTNTHDSRWDIEEVVSKQNTPKHQMFVHKRRQSKEMRARK